MGVRGLTTYIANNHGRYLKNFKLHDCYIIIDGNSLAYHIYVNYASRAHCAFGGDYDKYAQDIKDFFNLLSKCAIKPVILFDGGYEQRKVDTVVKRMKDRMKAFRHIVPASPNCVSIFPLLMKNVIKEVLREIGVPFVQCDHEADQEIASLARKYKCPVLSNDSDFYIFDVSYIPISTLSFDAVPLHFKLEEVCDKYCMPCKIYKVELFLNSFGGLDKCMMPLLASLLGNDYIKIRVFRKFYSQFQLPKKKGNLGQRRVARLIEWLRNETFDSAIERILGRMKVTKHIPIKRSIMKAVNAYTCSDSTVEQYLPSEFTNSIFSENFSKACQVDCTMPTIESTETVEEMDVGDGEDFIDNEDNSQSDEGSLSEDEDKADESGNLDNMDVEFDNRIVEMACKILLKMPEWLVVSSRKGNIEPCVYDILTLRTYFALPQIEDNFYTASHSTSIPLIKKISKLLLGDLFENITVWMRNNNGHIQKFLLHLTNTPIIADINRIPKMPVVNRLSLFMQCLDIPDNFCVGNFPNELKLYVCAIVSWIKSNPEPQITDSHVISLFMCIVALNLIHSKVGFYRKKVVFLKKYGKMQKRIINRIKDDTLDKVSCDINSEVNGEVTEIRSKDTTIKQIYSSITTDDCIAVFNEFYQYHQLDEDLKVNGKLFSKRTVHSFAQFQSCLYHAIVLNSLLNHPLDQPIISQLYSSTFIYNMCTTLSKVKSVSEHIQSFLEYSPNILNLIESMFTAVSSVVQIAAVQPQSKRNKRKRKKISKKIDTTDQNVQIIDEGDDKNELEAEDEESYHDENNAFALLSTM